MLAFAAATALITAGAIPLTTNEESAGREVIVAQLQAFAEDDADTAFATATPDARDALVESGRFLAMVRVAYPMVYRPATVSLLKPEEDAGTVMQLVTITDDNDKSWLALF